MRTPKRGLAAALALALTAGCATPVQYFGEAPPVLPDLDEAYRTSLLDDLGEKLVESEIEVVELVSERETLEARPVGGRAPELERFPLAALEAAAFGAAREHRGAEFDLLVQRRAQPPGVIVTVRHDLDARLRVLPGGPPVALDGEAESSAELERRFGIGPLVSGDAAWTANERRALAASLALLSPGELAYLEGLPFRRSSLGSSEGHAGYYQFQAGAERGEIVLLDRAFETGEIRFVGTPERAYPDSIHVILHEVGHAVAKLDREKLIEVFRRDTERYNRIVEVANQYVEPLNERYAVVDRISNPRQQRLVRQDIRTLEREHRKVNGVLRRARGRLRRVERQLESPSPMEQAYAALPAARRGPTLYARTSVDEAFAEAFALFHLDPECIRRFSPEVHDWFAAGEHLSAAAYPPLEDVQPASVWIGTGGVGADAGGSGGAPD